MGSADDVKPHGKTLARRPQRSAMLRRMYEAKVHWEKSEKLLGRRCRESGPLDEVFLATASAWTEVDAQ